MGELLFDAPHALRQQGRAPREMIAARDNPDGWGVAWWSPGEREPHHYRTATVMWEDESFCGASQPATAVLGAVRKASPSTRLDSVNNAPFVASTGVGVLAFSLNGHAFHESCKERVLGAVRPGTLLVGDTDSETLFALLRDRIAGGADPADALAAVHHVVAPGPEAYVNLLLVGADTLAATTWRHSLYLHHDELGTTVASEPLDEDPRWTRVPDAHLLTVTADGPTTTPLEGPR